MTLSRDSGVPTVMYAPEMLMRSLTRLHASARPGGRAIVVTVGASIVISR